MLIRHVALISPEATKGTAVTSRPNWRRLRYLPLAAGALAMAFGLWTGLARLGFALPGGMPAMAEFHGAFMIAGFLGTLISLERAVALGNAWAYAAPGVSAAGAAALLMSMPRVGAVAFALAGAALLLTSAGVAWRQLALFTVVLVVGAVCWIIGNMLWLAGHTTPSIVGWWLDFLILTIASERLELSRIVRVPPSSQVAFAAMVLLLLCGAGRNELAGPQAPLMTAGLLGCAAWLLRHDIARRTLRQGGLPRFSACSIMVGHAWLAVAGLILFVAPPGSSAFSYDAAVHAMAIGFVLSMVFGHAPIILPALTGARVQYSSVAYASLVLLHISVALRIAGDLLEWVDVRAASGIVTVIALASYAMTLAIASWRATRGRATGRAARS